MWSPAPARLRIRLRLPTLALTGLVLAGCGGGGGSDAPTTIAPPPAPPPNQNPVASFALSTADGFAPLTVDFDASASTDSDGRIADYRWDFGDGSATSAGVTTGHTFADPGSYAVRLTVTDDDGATSSTQQLIRVRGTRLTGTVRVLSTSAVDSDVNDRFSASEPNNTIANAQPLPNPVRLGGFVNLPGTGEATGQLFAAGDAGDFYAITLTGNEVILLNIADAGADLDLRLWDDAGNVVDAALGDEVTESLNAPGPGNYVIEVFPADPATNTAGASNYVLSVGQDLSTAGRRPSRLSDPFVPGELLLAPPEGASRAMPLTTYDLTPTGRSGRISRTRLGERTTRLLRERLGGAVGEPALPSRLTPDQRSRYRTLLAAKQLPRDPGIATAEPNLLIQPTLTPNDSLYGLQWHLPEIDLPAAWDITTGSPTGPNDVIVAVVDTGILADHPDFADKLVPGYDFISDPSRARDGDGIDGDPTDEGDFAYGASSSFHGTHVAGTVAARTDNGAGVAGVSWGAKLMPLRALGEGGGTTFDVIDAVRWAAGLPVSGGPKPPQQPADIINLSLGSGFSSAAEQTTYGEVRGAGVIVVASAGNESSSNPSYPAAYEGVVSVSATTIDGSLAPYSSFGAIDVAAPGGYNATDLNGDGFADGVVSTLGDDSNAGPVRLGYGALNGTSMAAPHVAGVAALMKALHPGLTPAEFDSALANGDLTDDLGAPGYDQLYGFGLINAQKAVLAAIDLASGGGADPGPILGSSLAQVNLGVIAATQIVVLSNRGTGDIVIDQVAPSEPWLAVSPANVDSASGLGEYELRVDRAGLAEGAYSATALFVPQDPATNSATISVTMQVAGASPDADAGLFYVIAVDDDGNPVGDLDVVEATNGEYPFTLEDIPAGTYRLFAGSDMDDDSFLCDAGEACGAYRTLDALETIVVDPQTLPTITELDFVSEFRAVISGQSTGPDSARTRNPAGVRLPKTD